MELSIHAFMNLCVGQKQVCVIFFICNVVGIGRHAYICDDVG